MITLGTIAPYNETVFILGWVGVFVGIIVLHVFWFFAGMLHKWRSAKVIRALWLAYMITPVMVGCTFAWSVFLKPLSSGCDSFSGGDIRETQYLLVWLALGSVIAICGTLSLIAQAYCKRKKTIAGLDNTKFDEIEFMKRWVITLAVVVLAIGILLVLPIYNPHGDFDGTPHRHFIWNDHHVH